MSAPNFDDAQRKLLERLEEDVREIREEIAGGGRFAHPSILERLQSVEEGLQAVRAANEDHIVERKLDRTARKAFMAGLSALGVLSGVILWIVYRILQAIAGIG